MGHFSAETRHSPGQLSAEINNFSQVLVGIRTQLQITVLQERFAEFGQIGFVGWLRADVQVARPAALAKIVGIKP